MSCDALNVMRVFMPVITTEDIKCEPKILLIISVLEMKTAKFALLYGQQCLNPFLSRRASECSYGIMLLLLPPLIEVAHVFMSVCVSVCLQNISEIYVSGF